MGDESRLADVLADYAERCERGEHVDPEDLIRQNADIAADLRAHFAAARFVDAALAGLTVDEHVPDRVGPFSIERELGAGGMGRVFLATAGEGVPGVAVGEVVALKLVHPHLLHRPGFFRRFVLEAELGRRVRHDNVVRTLFVDAAPSARGTDHFLVMEYVRGQTLRELLDELEALPEELCRHVGREVALALGAIHGAGVVHRDLKPENVLVTPDHHVKVMDLGVAQLQEEALHLSMTGAFVGSVPYAAPEQFGAGPVDNRCDLHALGLLLYEMACGRHPYRADDFHGVMRQVLDVAPRPVGEVNPQLSPFFEHVVHTLLAKSPDDRFPDAATTLAVLEEGEDSPWWEDRAKALRAATNRPLRHIRVPRETAVYGREVELERLRALFERARSGEGQVVLLEGEAGIGKSRVVDELVARLQADGEDFSFLCGSYPPGGAATAAGGFSSAYREHFGEAGSAAYLAQTPLLVPAFDALLRGEPAPSGVLELTKDSLGTCFVHATRNLAAERPTVVLIDDLHFAPEEARALFTAIALGVPGHRVLLVGTMRPGVPEEWIANVTRLDHAIRLELPRLGPKDLFALLRDCFASEELAHQLAGRIGVKSDGNPFFAFEIIRGLREGQFITRREDGTWTSTRVIEELEVPSTVLDLVNARVSGLSEDERNLLDMAACWGFDFDPVVVGDALGMARIPTLRTLGQIERRHRLVRSKGRRYCFDHHQVQEALYGALNDYLRQEYHSALAAALESSAHALDKDPPDLDGALCVDLCDHYLKGGRGESALRYLAAAQTHLATSHLHAQVVSLTELALAVSGLLTGTARANALLPLDSALDRLGRRVRQEECAREIERLAAEAGDAELGGRAARALGRALLRTSRLEEAAAAFRRAIDLARSCGDKAMEARATGNLGLVLGDQGRSADAERHFDRQLALSREIGDRSMEAAALGNLGSELIPQGRFAEARAHGNRALALHREIGDLRGEATMTGNVGLRLFAEGRLREARGHFERQLTLSDAIGDRQGVAIATSNLGCWDLQVGRLVEARELLDRSLALSREIGDREGEAVALVNLGPLHNRLGDRARTRAALERAVALCREIGVPYPEGYGLLSLGRLEDEEGDIVRALELTQQALALRRQIRHTVGVAEALLELGDIHARAGNVEAARAALGEAVTISRDQGRHDGVARGLALLSALSSGDAAVTSAAAALAAAGEIEEGEVTVELRLSLFRLTRDRAQLDTAKRMLDETLANVPSECREAMCQNVRLHREILAEWRSVFGEDADADESRGAESVTRAG